MGPIVPRLVALLATLPLGPPGPAELPATAVVAVDSLDAFAEPDPASFVLDRLRRGDRLRVVDVDASTGWLTVDAPASAFSWVEQAAVRPEGPGLARVSAARTELRAGVAGARMPGPPRGVLDRGDLVRLVERAPLSTSARTTWLAIRPPAGEVRHVRTEEVAWQEPPGLDRPAVAPSPEVRARYEDGPPALLDKLPPEVAAAIARIEAEHRAALSGPVESWRLEPVARRYEALGKTATDPASTAMIEARLALVARHAEIARSARSVETILARSRRRDRDVASVRRNLDETERPQRSPFAAEGLFQPSSRQVDGRRVYALIGPEGAAVAYLDIPPGLDARPVLAKRVGVRGTVRYDDSLRAKLIAVRDLEPLEK